MLHVTTHGLNVAPTIPHDAPKHATSMCQKHFFYLPKMYQKLCQLNSLPSFWLNFPWQIIRLRPKPKVQNSTFILTNELFLPHAK